MKSPFLFMLSGANAAMAIIMFVVRPIDYWLLTFCMNAFVTGLSWEVAITKYRSEKE